MVHEKIMRKVYFILLLVIPSLIWFFSFLLLDDIAKYHISNTPHHFEKIISSFVSEIYQNPFNINHKKSQLESLDYLGHNLKTLTLSRKSCVALSDVNCQVSIPFSTNCKLNPYVKFWEDHGDCYLSPLYQSGSTERQEFAKKKYLVFQPDLGGWNNIRMSLELVIVFAHTTGRILVMPPDSVLYLLAQNIKWKDNKSSIADYYNLTRLAHGLDIITMEQFLNDVAAKGLLSIPLPNNNTKLIKKPLWEYLETACYSREWLIGKTFIGFNLTKTSDNVPIFGSFENTSRLRSHSLDRDLIPYDSDFHKHTAIFFSGQAENRILTHFYAYLYWADPSIDRFYKRFIRDRLRYHDSIFCTAGKIVELLHKEYHLITSNTNMNLSVSNIINIVTSKSNQIHSENYPKVERTISPNTISNIHQGPTYFAYHIRRGEFQQKHTRISAHSILQNTLPLLNLSITPIVYIATDEKNRTFFEPFRQYFKSIRYLSDYFEPLRLMDQNQNHMGMLEQIICANAHTFFGTPLSTFTAYITRLRGYHNKTDGRYLNTFYTMPKFARQLQLKPRLQRPIWVREFVDAFQDIDDNSC